MTRVYWILVFAFSLFLTAAAQRQPSTFTDPLVPVSSSLKAASPTGSFSQSTPAQASTGTPVTGPRIKSNAYPATTHERFATFLTEGDFKSRLLIQNLRIDLPVTVTPALLLASGEVPLDPVSIPAHSAVKVDINAALQAHGAADTRGAVKVSYDFGTYGAVSAVVEISDYSRRLYMNSVAQSREEFWYGTTLDAVVWAPRGQEVEGFLSMINTSADPKNVQISFFSGGKQEDRQVIVPPYQARQVTIDSLVRHSTESGAGIHLAYTGNPGDIVAESTLLSKQTGFSKLIRFMDSALRFPSNSIRTNFLLLGPQPEEDGFPATVSFRSVAAVRNVGSTAVSVSPIIRYLQGNSVRKISLTALELAPNESRIIDFTQEQRRGSIPSDFTQGALELAPDTGEGKVIAELFNFNDRTGGYVVGSSFAARPSRATSSIWRIDGTFQTTIVIQNTATQGDQVTLKLFSGPETYEKTFPVAAGGLIKINLKQLQENAVPDKNGHTLVSTTGTLSLSGAHATNSALAYDKIIHSADESEYVGLLAQPCDFVTGIDGFLSGPSNPYTILLDDFWTDGGITESSCCISSVSNTSALQVNFNGSAWTATMVPGSTAQTVDMFFSQTTTTCDICSGDTLTSTTPVQVPALSISGISPAQGLAAAGTNVTISGVGFAAGASIHAGSNIAVSNVNVVSANRITATFSPTASASGNQGITVTVNGMTSNSVNFFVQVPTASRIVQTTTNGALGSGQAPCASGQAGWMRVVTKIVTDQSSKDIVASGQNLTEHVTIGTPNDLNISGVQTGTAATNSAGQFMDTFFVCTALCPQSTGTTAASQTITDAPPNGGSFSLSANGIAYKCGGITINGQ